MTTPIDQKSGRRCLITKLANVSMKVPFRVSRTFALAGNIATKAGRNVTARKKAKRTPMEVMLPRSRNGGASLKFMLRKPIAVVMDVRKIGVKLILRLSTTADGLSMPRRRL